KQLESPVARAGAHVDVQLLELGSFGVFPTAQPAAIGATHDPGDRAAARQQLDPLAAEDLGVPAPDAPEVDEALVVHVGDDQPDLVDMPEDSETGPTAGTPYQG